MHPDAPLRRTKIIATLGPATDASGMLLTLIRTGVDVVRLNFSHGEAQDHAKRVRAVRAAAQQAGREVAVLGDLQGPKIRIRRFADGPVELHPGARFTLDCDPDAPHGDASRVGVLYFNLYQDVRAGDTLLLDDGLIALKVEEIVGCEIRTRVLTGGRLSDRKGINRLGGGLTVAALTDKDREDIKLAAELKVDYVAVSFCKSAEDMHECRRLLREAGSSAHLVAKIERAEAIENLTEIVEASDVIMVARGDLAVEIGDAELPGLQKKIIRESIRGNRAVITATQMMQSMVSSPMPTRAEVLDVANAVLDGTDAVMLSEETAAGKHPALAVAAMVRVCLGAERQFEPRDDVALVRGKIERPDQAIALAAMFLCSHVNLRAIIALTESGGTARWLSRFHSKVPIYALSRHQAARQRMAIFRDVYPVAFDSPDFNPVHAVRDAVQHLFLLGSISEGDRVLLTVGDHVGELGGTNTLKLLKVGPGGIAEGMADL